MIRLTILQGTCSWRPGSYVVVFVFYKSMLPGKVHLFYQACLVYFTLLVKKRECILPCWRSFIKLIQYFSWIYDIDKSLESKQQLVCGFIIYLAGSPQILKKNSLFTSSGSNWVLFALAEHRCCTDQEIKADPSCIHVVDKPKLHACMYYYSVDARFLPSLQIEYS